ncbi:hypothetical protein EIP91_010348 [Steccherinum ochraceum]|uniref:Uncharacterized protein n=1 Tax=Steccherinum ochraceum TaxID=92696 RepID=A0A4R0RCX7_9APHY|nr:hypothetical protein EIP91_010348 [Steccherinum ochraceum]
MSLDLQHIPEGEAVSTEGLKLSITSFDVWTNKQPGFSSNTSGVSSSATTKLSLTLDGSFIADTLGSTQEVHDNAFPNIQLQLVREGSGVMVDAVNGPAWIGGAKYCIAVSIGGTRVKTKAGEVMDVV